MQTEFYYSDRGSGSPILFLHGFCESRWIWSALENSLSKQYRVITVDFPGFGEAARLDALNSMEDFAQWLKSFLDHLSLSQSPIVVGHSLGGYVALEAAHHFPDIFSKIVLMNSTILADDAQRKINRDRSLNFIARYGYDTFVDIFVPSLFPPEKRDHNKRIIDILRSEALTASEDAVKATTLAMRDRRSYADIWHQYACPIYFIGGEEDITLPEEKRNEMKRIFSTAHFHLLPGVGHVAMLEAEESVLRILNQIAF